MQDVASGLYYIGARWMDPELGRWLSLDPELGRLSQPQSMNRYVYCVNNPLRFTDPTGTRTPQYLRAEKHMMSDEELNTWFQVIVIVAAVAATVATAGIASPMLAMAVGATIGATSSFASTYAATGDLEAALWSAVIGGAAGAVGGGVGAKLLRLRNAAQIASAYRSTGCMTSGWSSADEAAFGLRVMFKHNYIRLSGKLNLGKLAYGSNYWATRGFSVSDDVARSFGQVMGGAESGLEISAIRYAFSTSPEWKLVGKVAAGAAAERVGHMMFERIGELMSKRSTFLPTFG